MGDIEKSTWAESGCETQLVIPPANGLSEPVQQRVLHDEGWEPAKHLTQQDSDSRK